MSTIAATNSSPYLAPLLDNITSSSAGDGSQTGNADNASNRASNGASDSQAATDSVVLSDRAKQVLARAQTDKVAADQLAAYVQSLRTSGNKQHAYASQASSDKPAPSSNQGPTFEQLAGIIQTSSTTVTTTTTTVNTSVAASDGTGTAAPDDGGIHPGHSFANTLSFGDFTISAKGDSLTDNSDVEIYAQNLHAYNVRWGGYSGGGGVGDGGTGRPSEYAMVGSQTSGNQTTFIFAKNSAAVAVAAAQDANGSVVQASAAAESDVVTITVDFNTGKISATETDLSASAALTRIQKTA